MTITYFRLKMTNGRPSRIEIYLFISFMISLICVYHYTLTKTLGEFIRGFIQASYRSGYPSLWIIEKLGYPLMMSAYITYKFR